MSLFTQEVIGKCEKCGTDVSLNTLRSHDCIEKAEKDMDKLQKVPSGKYAQEKFPPRVLVCPIEAPPDCPEMYECSGIEQPFFKREFYTEYLSIQEHLSLISQPPAAPRQTDDFPNYMWIGCCKDSGEPKQVHPVKPHEDLGDLYWQMYFPADFYSNARAESAAEIERLKNGEELMHTIWKNLRAEISSLEKQLSEQGLVVRQLGEALTEAIQDCGCTYAERVSGHKTDCGAPRWNEALAARAKGREATGKAEEYEKTADALEQATDEVKAGKCL